jgi:hypothetical protein
MNFKRAAILGAAFAVGLVIIAIANLPLFYGKRYELLLQACGSGDTKRVRLLLALGADPNGLSDHYAHEFTYPIDVAANDNHPEIIRLLVGSGAQVNVADSEGGSPLRSAAISGATEAAKVLLDCGAETTTENGSSVLTVAKRFGHVEIARMIEAVNAERRATEHLRTTRAKSDTETDSGACQPGANTPKLDFKPAGSTP